MSLPPYVRNVPRLEYYLKLRKIMGTEQEVAEAFATIDAGIAHAVALGADPRESLHNVAEPYLRLLLTGRKLLPEDLCRDVAFCLEHNITLGYFFDHFLIPQVLSAPLPSLSELQLPNWPAKKAPKQ